MSEVRLEEFAPKVFLLRLRGYLDRDLGESLKEGAQKVADLGCGKLIITFAEVPMINSLGMTGLIEAIDVVETAGGETWLVDVGTVVMPVIEAAGILDLVTQVLSLEQAREMVRRV